MKKNAQEEPTFEEALEQLESIVAAMEKGDVPLAELVAKYEKASQLLARCRACLDQAEMTIERLRDAKGVETEPFHTESSSDSGQASD